MRQFKRGHHDGLVLDDVRDLQFLVNHQEKLQGKYDCLVEFGSTAGGTCAYHRDLFGVPVVATINFSTKNLQADQQIDDEQPESAEEKDEACAQKTKNPLL